MRRAILSLGAAAALAGCGATPVDLAYKPASSAVLVQGRSVIAVGTFTDRRGEDPRWLGTARGGFGNPVKTIVTEEPVSEVVRRAFADGLAARGLAAPPGGGAYTLAGDIETFNADQFARREATTRIGVTLIEAATGRPVMSQTYEDTTINGSRLSLATGVFASTAALRDIAAESLRHVVDKALDGAAIRAAATAAAPAPRPAITQTAVPPPAETTIHLRPEGSPPSASPPGGAAPAATGPCAAYADDPVNRIRCEWVTGPQRDRWVPAAGRDAGLAKQVECLPMRDDAAGYAGCLRGAG